MKRCAECRGWFDPAVTAPGHQRVCGPDCRKQRRAKLARKRRRSGDAKATREDERERQAKSRRARAAAGGPPGPGCHEPASERKLAISPEKMSDIVDKILRASLPGFAGKVARQAAKIARIAVSEEPRAGP